MTAQCPPPTDAFRNLSRVLANRDGRVLEFEILPPAFGPFLEDGCSVGITKKGLIQAFVVARKIFFSSFKSKATSTREEAKPDLSNSRPESEDADKKLVIASEIILLFDCEHLTACNWRKRRLRALFDSEKETLMQALDDELSLMTTYINSPLHRHTKSPTLWQHRQWVQSHLIGQRKPSFQTALHLFNGELSVALRAGEIHPRNYYAFTYMRQIHRVLCESDGEESEDWSMGLGQAILGSIVDWCLAHPADISGLMFLLYLLDAVPDTALRIDTVAKLLSFALDVGWEGESLWIFIDLAIRGFNLRESSEQPAVYPWVILNEPNEPDKAGSPWRALLNKARVHWAHSSSTITSQP
ncbi:uncharacterized protein BDV14DRAFT_92759 [Aspergillus stella-maris]|uniref:uncharacterized protein n=1 Tax=Aspergillus stella-maris TaxID=1810926 RepID=UPI003CCD039D